MKTISLITCLQLLLLVSCSEDLVNMEMEDIETKMLSVITTETFYITDHSSQYLALLASSGEFLNLKKTLGNSFTFKHFRVLKLSGKDKIGVHLPIEIDSNRSLSLYAVIHDQQVKEVYLMKTLLDENDGYTLNLSNHFGKPLSSKFIMYSDSLCNGITAIDRLSYTLFDQ